MRRFVCQRGAAVTLDDFDGRSEFAQVGKRVLSDGSDSGVDLVKRELVAGLTVSGDRACAEPDDADVAGAAGAAEAQCESYSRILRIISGWRAPQFLRAKDLRSVLDGSVQQRAQCGAGKAVVLANAEAGVEVAH